MHVDNLSESDVPRVSDRFPRHVKCSVSLISGAEGQHGRANSPAD